MLLRLTVSAPAASTRRARRAMRVMLPGSSAGAIEPPGPARRFAPPNVTPVFRSVDTLAIVTCLAMDAIT